VHSVCVFELNVIVNCITILCCTTETLRQIYVAGFNNKHKYVYIHSDRFCAETKEYSFAYGLLYAYSLAGEVVMTDKLLLNFSVSINVA
jgi:hypothetical protein